MDDNPLPAWLCDLREQTSKDRRRGFLKWRRIPAEDPVELVRGLVRQPMAIGVLGDFSGASAIELPAFSRREFQAVSAETFEAFMRGCRPQLRFTVPHVGPDGDRQENGTGTWPVDMEVNNLADFAPEAVVRQNPPLLHFLAERTQIGTVDGEDPVERMTQFDRQLSAQLSVILQHSEFQTLETAWRGLHYLVSSLGSNPLVQVRVLNVSHDVLCAEYRDLDHEHLSLCPLYQKLVGRASDEAVELPFALLIGNYYFDQDATSAALLKRVSEACSAIHAPFIAGAAPGLLDLAGWEQLRSTVLDADWSMEDSSCFGLSFLDGGSFFEFAALAMPRVLGRLPYRHHPIPGLQEESNSTERSGVARDAASMIPETLTSKFLFDEQVEDWGWLDEAPEGYCLDGASDRCAALPVHPLMSRAATRNTPDQQSPRTFHVNPDKFLWVNAAFVLGASITQAATRAVTCGHPAVPSCVWPLGHWPQFVQSTPGGGIVRIGPLETPLLPRQQEELKAMGMVPLFPGEVPGTVSCHNASSLREKIRISNPSSIQFSPTGGLGLPGTVFAGYFIQRAAALLREWRKLGCDRNELAALLRHWLDEHVLTEPDSASAEMRIQRPLRSAWLALEGTTRVRLSLVPHGGNTDGGAALYACMDI